MRERNLIVGTAGHIDHGKTSLVRALTGIDTDRLEEEKRRGITIDIGFAHADFGNIRAGFIDVPGHEKFVKNMLAGIGGVHMLLLVVAADESVMPQTVEHFEICRLLEIPRGIVVLTKSDLVEPDLLEVVREEVTDLVRDSFLEGAPLVPVDSLSGTGIALLHETITDELEQIEDSQLSYRQGSKVFSLPIDRVFSMKGFGTVVTGTALNGSVQRDDSVYILPGSKEAKVRGIEIFGAPSPKAQAGQRTALNLSGVAKNELERGMTVVTPKTLTATRTLDVSAHLLPSAPGPLKHRDPIRFHHGSAEIMARIRLFDRPQLQPGETSFARLELDNETVCLPGDRFILRRYSPLVTVGGGIIIRNNPLPLRRNARPRLLADYTRLLPKVRIEGPARLRALLDFLVTSGGARGASLQQLVAATGEQPEPIRRSIDADPKILSIEQDPPVFLPDSAIDGLSDQFAAVLDVFHRQKPLASGISKEELKERLLPGISSAHFQFLLSRLEERGVLQTQGSTVARFGMQVALTDSQASLVEGIVAELRKGPFQAASAEGLARSLSTSETTIRELLHYLLNQGRLTRIAEDLLLLKEQLDEMISTLRRTFAPGQVFSVPQFKELFGISRKYAIPLLEFLDRQRITRRSGEGRTLLQG